LGRHLQAEDIQALRDRRGGAEMKFKQVPQGAATTVWAATSSELDGRGGLYCEDCNVSETLHEHSLAAGVMAYALDDSSADRLWSLSEEWSGVTFPV